MKEVRYASHLQSTSINSSVDSVYQRVCGNRRITNKPDRTGRGIWVISSLGHWCCLPHFVGSCHETEEILRIIPWAEGYLDSEIEQHGISLGEDEWTALLFNELDSSLLKKHRCKGRIPPTTCAAGCYYEQSTTNAQDCNTAVCFWESKLDFYRVVNMGES